MLILDLQDMLHRGQDLIEQGAQTVKNSPSVQEIWIQPLGWEDPLEEGMATRSYSYLENPKDRGAWLQSMGLQRIRHD